MIIEKLTMKVVLIIIINKSIIEVVPTRKVVSTVGAKASCAAQVVGGDVRVKPSNRKIQKH